MSLQLELPSEAKHQRVLAQPLRPRRHRVIAEVKVECLNEYVHGYGAVDTPERVAEVWRDTVQVSPQFTSDKEHFVMFVLSARRTVRAFHIVSVGTVDCVHVHPREVFRPAIMLAAHSIVLAHNHPTGDPTPSESDIKTTRDLIRAGQILKIDVLDHVIIGTRSDGSKGYCSLRELGYFFS